MEKWGIGANGYYGTASVRREVAPWWNFAAMWLVFRVSSWVPCWRLPRWWTERVIHVEGETYTWGEWHGTQLCQMTWQIEQPIMDWLYGRRQISYLEVRLADVLKAFGEHADPFWRKQWDDGTEMWKTCGPPNADRGGSVKRTADASFQTQ